MSRSELLARFARRFQIARKSLGYSQAELGIRIGLGEGVASTRINRYERGISPASMHTAEEIAEAAGLTISAALAKVDDLAFLITAYELQTPEERDAALTRFFFGVPDEVIEKALRLTYEPEAGVERKEALDRALANNVGDSLDHTTGPAAAGPTKNPRRLKPKDASDLVEVQLDVPGVGDEKT